VSQRYTKPEWEPASFGLEHDVYYLDVEFDIGGCHDDFDGIVGQLYQCKYATQANKFVWDASTEESFRLADLKSTTGAFDVDAPCYEKHEYGVLLSGEKAKSSSKRKRST